MHGRKTNLEWALNSSAVKIIRNPARSPTWVCGDHGKLQKSISYFIKHTSIHGVQFIWNRYRKLSRWKRIMYQLFFMACVFMMLGSVVLLLQESLTTESVYITVTDKDADNGIVEDPYFPEHPKIYICRRPSYRVDVNSSDLEFLEYVYLSLGFPYISLSPNEISLLIKSLRYQMRRKQPDSEIQAFTTRMEQLSKRYHQLENNVQNFNLTHFLIENSIKCEDVFISCQFILFNVDCCKEFKTVLTNFGVCFSYELSKERLKSIMKKKETSYFLLFDMNAAPRLPKAVNTGYEIFLLDPRNQDRTFTDTGYYTINGHQLSMRANLVKTSRKALYTPWHGFYTECPQLEAELDEMGYGERYFLASCVRNHVNRVARKKCGCRIITDYTDMTLKECNVEKQLCLNSIVLRDNLTAVSEACKHPCVEYHYDVTTSLVKMGRSNISRFVFVYERNQYSLEEYKRTTLSSSLSQIGGSSGLYIGASIISALEVFLLLISCVWYRCMPHKRISNTSELKKWKRKEIHSQ